MFGDSNLMAGILLGWFPTVVLLALAIAGIVFLVVGTRLLSTLLKEARLRYQRALDSPTSEELGR
jgi:membrane protein implicated in regulation of membrane protease activity